MKWNWEQRKWPNFKYNPSALAGLEREFLMESSKLIGASSVITEDERKRFTIELMSEEALKSSRIEGEILNRDSITSSLLRQLGLAPQYSDHRANDKEKGIAALMVDNYQTFDQPLTHGMMFKWLPFVINNLTLGIKDVGLYRTSENPMQVVSERNYKYTVHFEAPPAAIVPKEMDDFVQWFNDTSPSGKTPLPALTRAGLAHLYFVSIHPFEDGNGRISRALSEKALTQSIGQPALFALSHHIEKSRKEYYNQLEKNQGDLTVDAWLAYFSNTAIDAAKHSQKIVRFIVEKSRVLDRVRGQVNQRQEKALIRMFDEGVDGFQGGLSADNYNSITGANRRTTSRDLQALVKIGALTKTGQLKGTRYWLNMGSLKSVNSPRNGWFENYDASKDVAPLSQMQDLKTEQEDWEW